VCHVLRYTPYTGLIRRLLDDGRIGRLISVEHLEPVGWWHQAHSFVRGNWNREDASGPMLLTKSCHDIDWLVYLFARLPVRVSSFGSLTHFRAADRPDGAAEHCLDCPVEASCPYSAKRLYLRALADRHSTSGPWVRSLPNPPRRRRRTRCAPARTAAASTPATTMWSTTR
jgi:predicted dehydrogenase